MCLEWFASAGIPDHLLFKEVGKALLPQVKEMSVGDVTRVVRAHGSVQISQSELFASVYERLASVVSRANMSLIRDIVCALARLDAAVPDCAKMADLCLNRYSLWAKEEVPVSVERDMLVSLARLNMANPRIARKALYRIISKHSEISTCELAEALSSINRLGMDVGPLWRTLKVHRATGIRELSAAASASLANVFGVIDPAFVMKSAANSELQSADRFELVKAYQHLHALTALCVLEPAVFNSCARALSVSELRTLEHLVDATQSRVTLKPQPYTYLKQRTVSLTRTTVGGLLETQLVHSDPHSS